MTVPPPYDPVLLREHAFYDTGIKSLVIAPGTEKSGFHSVAEKGLGLFNYNFALTPSSATNVVEESDYHQSVRLLDMFWILGFITICYFVSRYLFASTAIRPELKERRSSSLLNTIVQNSLLLSPFSRRTKQEDIESAAPFSFPSNFQEHLHTPPQTLPLLSHSVTNTPTTPPHNEFLINHNDHNLLRFIESDASNRTKLEKIH